MNVKFFDLPSEKQNTIINAAMSVFAHNDYKRATTDDIIKKANISKGLLFYYFENKKGLYFYVYNYAEKFLITEMSKNYDQTETDFFEMLIKAQISKIKIMSFHPDLFGFLMKAYLEKNIEVKDCLNDKFKEIISSSSETILNRTDTKKFKNGVSAKKVLDIIIWTSEGFIRSRTTEQLQNLIQLNEEFIEYLQLMKQNFYKEIYL